MGSRPRGVAGAGAKTRDTTPSVLPVRQRAEGSRALASWCAGLVLVHHREAAITALNSQAKSCWTTARALSVWSQRPRGRGERCPAVWISASSRNSPVRRTAPRPLVVPRGDTFAPTTVRANVRRTPNARAIMSPAAPDTWNRPASRRVAPSRKVSTPLTPRSRVLPSGAQVFGRRALLRRCCEAPVDLRCPGIVRTRL